MTGAGFKGTIKSTSTGVPVFRSKNGGSIRIRFREYLSDVFSSGTLQGAYSAFSSNTYPLNPGLPRTFPWLSQIAANYQQYRFNGLVFEYKSTSGNAVSSTNAALGTVAIATQYNALAPLLLNKREVLNTEFSSVSNPSCDVLQAIECKKSMTAVSELYIRTPNTNVGGGNIDLRLYDFGNTQIVTEGIQAASVNLGELWVTYDVTLMKPITTANAGYDIPYARYSACSQADDDLFGLYSGNPPTLSQVGNMTSPSYDSLGLAFYVTGLTQQNQGITFPASTPPGNYVLMYSVNGEVATTTGCPPIGYQYFPNTPGTMLPLNATQSYGALAYGSGDYALFAPVNNTTVNCTSLAFCCYFTVTDNFTGGNWQLINKAAINTPTTTAPGHYNTTIRVMMLPNIGF